jgi:hypothetical protein
MNQKDKEFILELKKKLHIEYAVIDELWQIYLRTFGKYPNYEKKNACSRCIMDVINALYNHAMSLPQENIEEKFKDEKFKPADTLEGKRKRKDKE